MVGAPSKSLEGGKEGGNNINTISKHKKEKKTQQHQQKKRKHKKTWNLVYSDQPFLTIRPALDQCHSIKEKQSPLSKQL